jgi:deoxycytidylate deaminase
VTCAKRIVRCTIITRDGIPFTGENACENPQPACPRGDDDGYEKCKTICQQPGHAEIQALEAARGEDLAGAKAIVTGIDHLCKECARALSQAGIDEIVLRIRAA